MHSKKEWSCAVAQQTRAPERIRPLLQPAVEIMMATTMKRNPASSNLAWGAAAGIFGHGSSAASCLALQKTEGR